MCLVLYQGKADSRKGCQMKGRAMQKSEKAGWLRAAALNRSARCPRNPSSSRMDVRGKKDFYLAPGEGILYEG